MKKVKEANKSIIQDSKKQLTGLKYTVLVGLMFLIADIVLVSCSVLSLYSLIITLPLAFVVRMQLNKYLLDKMTHNFKVKVLNDLTK